MHAFEKRLAASWPPGDWRNVTVVVAISGGADSTALLSALHRIKSGGLGRLCAAHFNHRLRDEADEDQRFVESLCGRLGVPCETGAADVASAAASTGESVEEAARRLRYAFLASAAGRLGARFVVAAHTADDQAETILHRILRGTGIGGLAGMPRARALEPATLIRPMLDLRRTEVLAYLNDLGQTYREDVSNIDCRFTRNRLRGELLPWLARHFNPRVDEALLRLGSLAGEVQQIIDDRVDALLEAAVRFPNPEQALLDRRELLRQPRYVLRELLIRVWRRQNWPLQAMGGAQWEQLAEMLIVGDPTVYDRLAPGESPGAKESIPERQTFPGAILADVGEDAMQLLRLPQ